MPEFLITCLSSSKIKTKKHHKVIITNKKTFNDPLKIFPSAKTHTFNLHLLSN